MGDKRIERAWWNRVTAAGCIRGDPEAQGDGHGRLGFLRLPAEARVPAVDGDRIWTAAPDSLDVPVISLGRRARALTAPPPQTSAPGSGSPGSTFLSKEWRF